MILSPNEIAWVALQQWTGVDAVTAVAVALAESGGDTETLARSSTGTNVGNRDHGLWQISNRWNGDKLAASPGWRDPVTAARLARAVFDETARSGRVGWSAWSVFASGKHTAYLPDAQIAVAHPFPVQLPAQPVPVVNVTAPAVPLSDGDVERIAARVADLLAERMRS